MNTLLKISALFIAFFALQMPIRAMNSQSNNQALELLKNMNEYLPNEIKAHICTFLAEGPLYINKGLQQAIDNSNKAFAQTVDKQGWTYPCIIQQDDKTLPEDAKNWSFTPTKDLVFEGDKTKQHIFYPSQHNVIAAAGPNKQGLMLVEDESGDHLSLVENEKAHTVSKFLFNRHRAKLWNRPKRRDGNGYNMNLISGAQLHPNLNIAIQGVRCKDNDHYSKLIVANFNDKSIKNETELYNASFDEHSRNPRKFVKFCLGSDELVWLAEVTKENKIALARFDYATKKGILDIGVEREKIDISALTEKIGYPLEKCTDLAYSYKHDADIVLIAGYCTEKDEQEKTKKEKTIFVYDTKSKGIYAVGTVPADQIVAWDDPLVLSMVKLPVDVPISLTSVRMIKPLLADKNRAVDHAVQVLNSNLLTQAGQHWIRQWINLKSPLSSKSAQLSLIHVAQQRLKEWKSLKPENRTLNTQFLQEGKEILNVLFDKGVIGNHLNVICNTTNPLFKKENLFKTIHKVVKNSLATEQITKNAAPSAMIMKR